MKNIEPKVYRQRFIIEARYGIKITRETVKKFLLDLATELGMRPHPDLPGPIITSATGKTKPIHNGYEGVLFWVESGSVLYVWEKLKFLTLDIYSCKKFNSEKALKFTGDFFKLSEVAHREIM